MVADAFDDGSSTGVSYAKTLSGAAVGEEESAGGAIHDGVAEDGVFGGSEFYAGTRLDNDLTGRHAFANVIIGFAC